MERTTLKRDLIVIGASAGGVDALIKLTGALPPDLPAAVLVAQHVGRHPSRLPELLQRRLPARHATQGMIYRPGHIYVAPPDRHLLVHDGALRLSTGPKENLTRPAIDPLFRSAAVAKGPRTIGILLTGHLNDGTAGLLAIKQAGGATIVQDPLDAEQPDMPRHALAFVDCDYRARLDEIPDLLDRLTREVRPSISPAVSPALADENALSLSDGRRLDALFRIGEASGYTCPSCNGALFDIADAWPPRYRCHTGHAFSRLALLAAQERATEDRLWSAMRSLQEYEAALRGFAQDRGERDPESVRRTHEQAESVHRQIEVLRAVTAQFVSEATRPIDEGNDAVA